MRCGACGRDEGMPCRSTRDMEDAGDVGCRAMLMMLGGGEYTSNRLASGRWHAALLLSSIEAGLAAREEADVADCLREMAAHGLVARGEGGIPGLASGGTGGDAIREGLVAAGLARFEGGRLLATETGRDVVLGRVRAWTR